MCTNKYSNKERYDKVIAKTKWCSFLCLTVYIVTLKRSSVAVSLHYSGEVENIYIYFAANLFRKQYTIVGSFFDIFLMIPFAKLGL